MKMRNVKIFPLILSLSLKSLKHGRRKMSGLKDLLFRNALLSKKAKLFENNFHLNPKRFRVDIRETFLEVLDKRKSGFFAIRFKTNLKSFELFFNTFGLVFT
jgi:hypothetical protein